MTSSPRFLGEDVAKRLLSEHNNDADAAWRAIRNHRNTYKGLREKDRNAEHYLYALNEVQQNSYKFAQMHILTLGYSGFKSTSNSIGYIAEEIFGSNTSPYRDSPVTTDEYLAGYYGIQDGLFGIKE